MVHPTSGFYVKDDYEYVSVSSVLGDTSAMFDPGKLKGLEFWRRSEPAWEDILARAQRRGSIIHAEVEAALLGITTQGHKDEATYEEVMKYNIHEYVMHISPLLDLIKDENLGDDDNLRSDFHLEKVLFCPQGYAGTADARFHWNGKYTIWDWKTVRSYTEFDSEEKGRKLKPKSKYKDAFIQIGAYALANNILAKRGEEQTMITQGVICVCYDWREPELHVLDSGKLKKAALDFVSRFQAYCDLKETQFPRKLATESAQEELVEKAF